MTPILEKGESYYTAGGISTPRPGFTTFAEISTTKLGENVRLLDKQAGSIEMMAVVKADAYGHGVAAISQYLARAGIRKFMVATLNEALELRSLLPDVHILVASPPHPDNLKVYQDHHLDASITSDSVARAVLAAVHQGLKLDVHVKIETGMNRLGVSMREAPAVLRDLLANAHVKVAGIWSHLATAGNPDRSFSVAQVEKAYNIAKLFPSFDGYFHVGNSGALLNLRKHLGIRDKELVRLGGALLGIPASQTLAHEFGLQPIMSLKSRVIHVNTLQAGEGVSYGRTWRARTPTKIAIIGAGYADGYPSALSGKANVYIKDRPYPIIGRVCMDMLMVDLGMGNTQVTPEDEVVLFDEKHVDIYELAKLAGLVHYEICCRIPMRVPRHFCE